MEKSNSSNQSFQVIEDFLNDNFYFKNEKYKTIYESLYIKNKEDINSFVDYLHSLTTKQRNITCAHTARQQPENKR